MIEERAGLTRTRTRTLTLAVLREENLVVGRVGGRGGSEAAAAAAAASQGRPPRHGIWFAIARLLLSDSDTLVRPFASSGAPSRPVRFAPAHSPKPRAMRSTARSTLYNPLPCATATAYRDARSQIIRQMAANRFQCENLKHDKSRKMNETINFRRGV